MSRTDKDRPYWVADSYKAIHAIRCHSGKQECDLPIERKRLKSRPHWKFQSACFWEPEHARVWWQVNAPKWYVDHIWHNPERTRERVELNDAKKEYNATGDITEDFQSFQARHNASWYYW